MWQPDFIIDGETAGAAKINTIFNDARTTVNGFTRDNLRRGAFNRFLTPWIVPAGTPEVVAHKDTLAHTYDDSVFLASLRYSAFGADGGASSGSVNTGDRAVIGHNSCGGSSPPDASITSLNGGSGYSLTASSEVNALYVMFNCNVINVDDADPDVAVMMCIQRQNSLGNWFTVDRTERWLDVGSRRISPTTSTELVHADIPIRTLLTEEDAAGIHGIRAAVSLSGSTLGASVLRLGSFRLSVVPIRCSYTRG